MLGRLGHERILDIVRLVEVDIAIDLSSVGLLDSRFLRLIVGTRRAGESRTELCNGRLHGCCLMER